MNRFFERFARWAVCLLLCVLWLGVPGAGAHAAEVVDDRGQTVRFDRPATRVVSLLPSLTETVCVLGACNRLVAVDRYSDWPAQVQRLPKAGGGLDPNVEMIVALRPDVVLVSDATRVSERLSALGIKVLAFNTKTYADVQRVLQRVAVVLGVPQQQADVTWQGIRRGIAQAAQQIPPSARGARVFVEVSRGPFAAGESSFIGETLTQLGLKNVVGRAQGPFPRLNPEFVVRADPDLIVLASSAGQAAASYPGWAQMRAVRQQRVCIFNAQEADLLIHPGPRLAEGAMLMARCVAQKLGQTPAPKSKQAGR